MTAISFIHVISISIWVARSANDLFSLYALYC
jgi:hypothetical protein